MADSSPMVAFYPVTRCPESMSTVKESILVTSIKMQFIVPVNSV